MRGGGAGREVGPGTGRGHLETVLTLIRMTYDPLLVHMAYAWIKKSLNHTSKRSDFCCVYFKLKRERLFFLTIKHHYFRSAVLRVGGIGFQQNPEARESRINLNAAAVPLCSTRSSLYFAPVGGEARPGKETWGISPSSR